MVQTSGRGMKGNRLTCNLITNTALDEFNPLADLKTSNKKKKEFVFYQCSSPRPEMQLILSIHFPTPPTDLPAIRHQV